MCVTQHLVSDMDKGDMYYSTVVKMNVHTGTHVDAPAHFLKEAYKEGNTVDKVSATHTHTYTRTDCAMAGYGACIGTCIAKVSVTVCMTQDVCIMCVCACVCVCV